MRECQETIDALRTFAAEGRATGTYEITQNEAKLIIAEFDRLKSFAGAANAGPSFAEITKGLPRRAHEDASSNG